VVWVVWVISTGSHLSQGARRLMDEVAIQEPERARARRLDLLEVWLRKVLKGEMMV
jgi:hypothetical protein